MIRRCWWKTIDRVFTTALACSVRGCARPLHLAGRTLTCPQGHAFDRARSGYVNLTQPQDRRSSRPGDAVDALDARSRLLAAGIGVRTLDAWLQAILALDLGTSPVVVDLGCGSGDALGTLAARRAVSAIGIDLSPTAVDRAARRFPDLTWVAANADRRLPLQNESVHVVLSLYARRNPEECARVLAPGGWLLIAVPAQRDLIELRAAVQGDAPLRDRTAAALADHATQFALIERFTTNEQHRLGASSLHDLLRGTYRGGRAALAGRVAELTEHEVTLASDVLLLRRT